MTLVGLDFAPALPCEIEPGCAGTATLFMRNGCGCPRGAACPSCASTLQAAMVGQCQRCGAWFSPWTAEGYTVIVL